MKFEIIERDWFKRRTPTPKPKVVDFRVENFQLIKNHFCTMYITYDNGDTKKLISRVVQNHITKEWCVDGMHEALRVILDDVV